MPTLSRHSSESHVSGKSTKADRKRSAFLSVMPDDYDERCSRLYFIRLSIAIEGLRAQPLNRMAVEDMERWTKILLRESKCAYNGTCGETIREHKKGDLYTFATADSFTFTRKKCTRRPHTILTHLRDRHGATLLYPELPLVRIVQGGDKPTMFALEQVILEFCRIRKSKYDEIESTDDEELLQDRNRANLEELKGILRRKKQHRRDPV
ncbi:unnamed protein product [Heligmosomoides polygyrus]|uniref:Uncharacterized protein n=1 Tax=Heligmosomoides polygyrus TaxID=6339 RepID=A0A183FZH4_HELPZ|nr:unnamed protein product [Heligmosomoides polygyrus]